MHRLFNWKFTVGAAVVIVGLCVGIFLYARWDVQRFTESLGEPPVPSEREALTEKPTGQVSSAPVSEITSVSENLQQQETDLVESTLGTGTTDSGQLVLDDETTDPDAQELSDAELDALLDMFEQQVLSTLREAVDADDEELDNSELVDAIEEAYGHLPEVDVLAEVMERIDEGTTTLDNLIEMVEASSAIMPESMPDGTMSLLEMLYRARSSGGLISVGSMDGANVFLIGTSGEFMDSIRNGGGGTVEFRGTDGTKMELDVEGATVIK